VDRLSVPSSAGLRAYSVRLAGRDVVLLEGPAGWGECSPLPGYPCDPAMARRAAEEAALVGFPDTRRDDVAVNALVADDDFDPHALAGYEAVKVKVRRPEDLARVARVRDAIGRGVSLRVDVNGAWDVETAQIEIPKLARLGVELVEQPVATIEDLARVRRASTIAIAADECVRTVDDARRLRELAAADVVILKVQPLGGVRTALAVAEEAGVPAIPTSMMETSVGLAAGVALACALPEVAFACGFGPGAALGADVTRDSLLPVDGRIARRAVVPDPELLARYARSVPSSQVLSS
jgi:O-succinylbenzoate synthase